MVHGLEAFTLPSGAKIVKSPAEWVIQFGRALPSDRVTVEKVPVVAQAFAAHALMAGVAE